MSRTKRQENWILFSFIAFLFLFLLIIYYFITFTFPKIKEIENKKIETNALYNSIVDLESKWLSFSWFIELSTTRSDILEYKKELINSLDSNFYNNNFQNTQTWKTFDAFLEAKKAENDSDKNIKLQNEKDKNIIDILPYYSESYNWNDNSKPLTNFMFITYIESIIDTFNLESNDWIWIKNINLVKEYTSSESLKNPLEKNIYSIPLSLSLKWKKWGIINFLHYIENVWKITIDKNDNLTIQDDKYLKNIILKNDDNSNNSEEDYNIYKHQIIDIESIKFSKYLDNSTQGNQNENIDFLDFVKNSQWNEDFQIDIELLFYVRWYPFNELQSYIEKIYKQYSILKNIVENLSKDTTKDDYYLLKIKKSNDYLNSITTEINNTRKDSKNPEKIEDILKILNVYKNNFDAIEKIQDVKTKVDAIKKVEEDNEKKKEETKNN